MNRWPERISGGILVSLLGLSTWGTHKTAVALAEDIVVQKYHTVSDYTVDLASGSATYYFVVPRVTINHYTPGSIALTIIIGISMILVSFGIWYCIDRVLKDEDNKWWRAGTDFEHEYEDTISAEEVK